MGVLHASLGHVFEAMQTDRWLEARDEGFERGASTAWRAGIAARLGDLARGAALLEQARQEGMFWQYLHPLFHLYDAMGHYEPFVQSMGPRG